MQLNPIAEATTIIGPVFLKPATIYISWVAIHYAASHAYVYFCASPTMVGFIQSLFVVPAPHCQALRWAIYNGGSSIQSMWILFGMWIISYVSPIKT